MAQMSLKERFWNRFTGKDVDITPAGSTTTCAANLVGTEQFMKWHIKKPDNVSRVLEVTKEAAIAAANFAFDNGADYYVFAEPTASPGLRPFLELPLASWPETGNRSG
jgi:uroporphyrinogen-III decarboxylase